MLAWADNPYLGAKTMDESVILVEEIGDQHFEMVIWTGRVQCACVGNWVYGFTEETIMIGEEISFKISTWRCK